MLIFIDHKDNHDAVLIAGVVTNIAVFISIGSAFPWVRNMHHKYVFISFRIVLTDSHDACSIFERHHRFIGW